MQSESGPIDQQQRNFSTAAKSRGITSIEYKKSASENIVKYFVNREVTCGELRKEDVGRLVTMVGWLDSKKHGKFLQLKDGYGITQILIDPEDAELRQTVANVHENSIILVKGRVIARPPMMVRNNSDTGEIEILVNDFKILDPDEKYDGDGDETVRPMAVETAASEKAKVRFLIWLNNDTHLIEEEFF